MKSKEPRHELKASIIRAVKAEAKTRNEVDASRALKMPRFEYYRDHKHEWRWTLIWSNGKKRADSGEGYKRKKACLKAIDGIVAAIHYGDFRIVERSEVSK